MVNAANLAMFAGIVFAVIPAMAILYRVLHRFEGFFDEKRLFKMLMVGMAVGGAVTLVELIALGFHDPFVLQRRGLRVGVISLAATYPLIEGAAKTAALNWHTLAGRRDTPYYGVAFGLGFGAILTFILVGREFSRLLVAPGFALLTHIEIALTSVVLFVLFLSGMILHAVSGALVGKATGERDVLKALGYGAVVALPFYLAYGIFWAHPEAWARNLAPFASLALAWWLLERFGMGTLESIVPEDLAKQVRRDQRKRARSE